jgi:phage FluMu protein Com
MSRLTTNGDKPEPFNLPGYGLKCAKCRSVLSRVARTTTTEGFITRERRCPNCGEMHVTSERVIHSRPARA